MLFGGIFGALFWEHYLGNFGIVEEAVAADAILKRSLRQ